MKTRQVTITNITYITPIQMEGPIVTPMTLSESIVKDLIRRGYDVIEEVNGTPVKLTMTNFKNPAASLVKPKPTEETTTARTFSEKRFEKQAPVVASHPAPTPKPVETPKPADNESYDFGNEVDAVDTSIKPDEEAVGRLFTGRPIPDVSPNVEAIAEVDLAQEGTVEAGKPESEKDDSAEEDTNQDKSNNNGGNRLQNKRKHRR